MNTNLIVGRNKKEFDLATLDDYETSLKIIKDNVIYNTSYLDTYNNIKEIKNHKDDLFHFTRPSLSYLLNFIKPNKSVVTCHDIAPIVCDYFSPISKIQFKFAMKGMLKADRLIVDSNNMKEQVIKHIKYPEDKIDVIPLGTDHNRFKCFEDKNIAKEYIKNIINTRLINKIDKDTKIILYVGSEQPRKNLDTLIKALSLLNEVYPNFIFIKVGNSYWNDARNKLIKLINKNNLKNKVFFIDYVNPEKLAYYYNAADLFVFPSYYEGFGQPLVEAMACGCPILTNKTTSIPEIVEDVATCVNNPFNLSELYFYIVDMLYYHNLGKYDINKGIKLAEKYTWEKYTENVLKSYEKCYNE